MYARKIVGDNRSMRRGCFGGCLTKVVIVFAVFAVAAVWAYSSLTLETIGKADEAGLFGFLGEEYEDKTARDLGIEDLTIEKIVEYFKRKLSGEQTSSRLLSCGDVFAIRIAF